jgi:hypothetical protein
MTPTRAEGLVVEIVQPENHGNCHDHISQKNIWKEDKWKEKQCDKNSLVECTLERYVTPY